MTGRHPSVLFIAAGYLLPAGIEAYLLHYATELRRRGFYTRILVFKRLPRVKHRFLAQLEKRGIPIASLDAMAAVRASAASALLWIPWFAFTLFVRRRPPRTAWFLNWVRKRCAVSLLARTIRRQRPDVIHVKGRIIAEAWPALPSDRTVYQHALMGTVDQSWTPPEVDAFRTFAERIARVFAPGQGVADTLRREFRIARRVDAIFTMAPDEVGPGGVRYADAPGSPHRAGGPLGASVRFGIVCRFTEQKGISHILDAIEAFRSSRGDVDFTFAGLGPLEDTIRERIAARVWRHVRVVPVATPAAVLADMDVFVHPGLDDAMPVSMVEALMCGRPCIGTRVGGVPDLIREGVEGFLIEPGSSNEIAGAMNRFAGMTVSELAAFQRRARARYEEACTPEKVGAIVAEHYRAIMRGD